jgi:predicted nucleotidyltransferase
MYDFILKDFHLTDEQVLNVYPYGSFVYGTSNIFSDKDFIVVCNNETIDRDSLSSSWRALNATIYSFNSFVEKVLMHKISALECIFLPKDKLLKFSKEIPFVLNKKTLRESISEKASHSWVKSKKKFEVIQDRNVYVAKKSLFHSLRIIDFGIQIAAKGKIDNYSSCKDLWEEIYTEPNEEWDFYKEKYQNYFNSQMTEFRKLAPK